MPLSVVQDRRAHGKFKEWRAGMAANPREADYAWTVLARVLAVTKDRGLISVNICERGGRLYEADHAEIIWLSQHIHPACRLRLSGPDRFQNLHDVHSFHDPNRKRTDDGVGVSLERGAPLLCMFGAFLSRTIGVDIATGALLKRHTAGGACPTMCRTAPCRRSG